MEICTIGGYEEVGKNMTALKINDDVFLFDAGIYLPAIIEFQEEPKRSYDEKRLRSSGAIPNDLVLDELGWTNKVRALIIGHAHLDHVGAVPFIATRYPNAEIIATPFTMAVLDSILLDEKMTLKNPRKVVRSNESIHLKGKSETYKLDFVHTTHSTIQCVFVAVHSSKGVFFYALDFKFDNYPTLEEPPNYKLLKELGKKGIKALVVDSLYSGTNRKTASERIARNLVEDAISNVHDKSSALFITTFSSHIARLKSIVDFGKKTGRKIVFIGRSLHKYVQCAESVGKCPFSKSIMMVKYKKQINGFLKKVQKDRGKYLIVCTGHQGEPGSILDRVVKGETPFKFKNGDTVIFSSSVIPTTYNIAARQKMDTQLRKAGVRIQADVHVSGHGGREDLRDLVEMLNPEHIIPAHGTIEQETPMVELAKELGYKSGTTVHLAHNGKVLKL